MMFAIYSRIYVLVSASQEQKNSGNEFLILHKDMLNVLTTWRTNNLCLKTSGYNGILIQVL